MDPRSAYVHIPFCHRRCFYCDFPVVPLGDRADGAASGSVAAYLDLLHREIVTSPGGPPLATVYLGGGTPSMLSSAQVGGILEALDHRFGLAEGAELSLELDPASFDEARLAGYLAAGINRVSLGVRHLAAGARNILIGEYGEEEVYRNAARAQCAQFIFAVGICCIRM